MEHELIGSLSCGFSLILYGVDLDIFWEILAELIHDTLYLFDDVDGVGSLEFCDSEIDRIGNSACTGVLVSARDISRSRLDGGDILEEYFFLSVEYEWEVFEFFESIGVMIQIDRISTGLI